MPDLTQLALYFAASLVLAVTPGPGIFYVAARTLAGGRAEGVASSFGTGLGGTVHVIAGSLGVSAIVLASAELFTVLKLIGAAYLVWLGLRTIQSARQGASIDLKGGSAAYAASGIRDGASARPGLIRRLREASGAAMMALGIGLALAKRPAT
jgi:threonine/homoserine/homoserine lactone efflux protein